SGRLQNFIAIVFINGRCPANTTAIQGRHRFVSISGAPPFVAEVSPDLGGWYSSNSIVSEKLCDAMVSGGGLTFTPFRRGDWADCQDPLSIPVLAK
ncbi:MAG: hypothetical protein VXZ53_05225, partial [Planctomycetota bacterium]|nr:hypothetical protein [Planctomycetota bacterium]